MKYGTIIIFFIFTVLTLIAQINIPAGKTILVDSILIKKNWRTQKKIILRELEFNVGDSVDFECLVRSKEKIWNIGNFAKVDFLIDTIAGGKNLIQITAKDALTAVPFLSFNGNKSENISSVGFSDRNFLGRNIYLTAVGSFGTNRKDINLGVDIPRQLLYENMSLSFRISSGRSLKYRYKNNARISGIGYWSKQFSGNIGNPNQTDYNYTFSPNLAWNLFQHKTDRTLIDSETFAPFDYKINYLYLSVNESIGYIKKERHQKDGYLVTVGTGFGIGLNNNSSGYTSVGASGSYYKLYTSFFQLSMTYSTGYTTATLPSLIHYLGPWNIKGILSGEESGQAYYSANTSCSLTYVNKDWFALEQSIYFECGKGSNKYWKLYQNKPLMSVGTGFKFWIPMVPWLSASVNFTYTKNNNNWLQIAI